ncbi:FMN-dependent NADH-azoreductase [Streptomyces tateyamensis]|uniref:FMN dependent NADH:quinone oxidoreductase n=1 Tax=Streptomyces tateyamensis TaxID=565073 RepID=A0A2V4P9J4_9ACTN|nr:NAD(P)H-dependent oxidoreductase [Streptomyces tateyamensis]PYC87575.1 FMN-dependent NADH-azoreductase [Streptomyces tateyamensis]
MATLLHIDSSALSQGSVSRELTATYVREWQAAHPEGTVVRRDLGAEPVPHLTEAGITAAFVPAEHRSPEQQAAFALREELMTELEQADAVVIGAPMYNFSIPSPLKAWLDQVILVGRTGGAPDTTVAGKHVTVLASRGGSYAPGTPRADAEFAARYLETALTGMMNVEVETVAAEFTLARVNPALAGFIEAGDASKAAAHEQAGQTARKVAARLTEPAAV